MGSGKSTLVKQIAAAALERDFRVQYFAVDESAEDVKDTIASWGVDVSQYESDGKLSFVDMFDLIAQGRSFTLKHLGKKTMGIMDSLTPFFLMVEAKKVFQYGQVLKYATRFAKSIGIATLHTHVLDETIENAMVNFADIVLDMEKRKSEGPSHGGTLRLVKMGKTAPASRGYYYEMTENGIDISTAPMI